MNKAQAIHNFWNSFGIPAYDENSVPDKVPDGRGNMVPLTFPYITYGEAVSSIGNVVPLSASIWDRTSSWQNISLKADEIAKRLGEFGYYKLKLDEGYVWFVQGNPFAQRMSDPNDDQIKRIYLNVLAEFLTAY